MRKTRNPTIPFVVRVPGAMDAEPRAEAARHGTTASDIVRQALVPLLRELRRREAPFLTAEQPLTLCTEHGVDPSLPVPSSLLKAEAVHRNVSLDAPLREHLIHRLKEAGVL